MKKKKLEKGCEKTSSGGQALSMLSYRFGDKEFDDFAPPTPLQKQIINKILDESPKSLLPINGTLEIVPLIDFWNYHNRTENMKRKIKKLIATV